MKKFEDNGQWFKYCPRCKVIYQHPILIFGRSYNTPDGLNGYCKDCAYSIGKKWRENNPERYKESIDRWWADETNTEKHRNISREWKLNNKERKKELDNMWAKNNPEKIRKHSKRYRENNREKIKEKSLRYRKSKEGSEHIRRSKAKNRNLGYVELWDNDWPDEFRVDRHHINDLLVIPIPRITHLKTNGGVGSDSIKTHRMKMNEVIKKYYMIDVERLVSE